MAGIVIPDSETGVLLSAEERREVMGRLGGEGTASLRRSGGNAGGGSPAACDRDAVACRLAVSEGTS